MRPNKFIYEHCGSCRDLCFRRVPCFSIPYTGFGVGAAVAGPLCLCGKSWADDLQRVRRAPGEARTGRLRGAGLPAWRPNWLGGSLGIRCQSKLIHYRRTAAPCGAAGGSTTLARACRLPAALGHVGDGAISSTIRKASVWGVGPESERYTVVVLDLYPGPPAAGRQDRRVRGDRDRALTRWRAATPWSGSWPTAWSTTAAPEVLDRACRLTPWWLSTAAAPASPPSWSPGAGGRAAGAGRGRAGVHARGVGKDCAGAVVKVQAPPVGRGGGAV